MSIVYIEEHTEWVHLIDLVGSIGDLLFEDRLLENCLIWYAM